MAVITAGLMGGVSVKADGTNRSVQGPVANNLQVQPAKVTTTSSQKIDNNNTVTISENNTSEVVRSSSTPKWGSNLNPSVAHTDTTSFVASLIVDKTTKSSLNDSYSAVQPTIKEAQDKSSLVVKSVQSNHRGTTLRTDQDLQKYVKIIQNNPLEVADLFHIFANHANVSADMNGNMAVHYVDNAPEFGTRGNSFNITNEDEIYYIGNINNLGNNAFRGSNKKYIILGSNVPYEINPQDHQLYIAGKRMDQVQVANTVIKQVDNYIDFESEFNRLGILANTYAKHKQSQDVKVNFNDMNHQLIDVSNTQGNIIYVNVPVEYLEAPQPIYIQGISSDQTGPMIVVNVIGNHGTVNFNTQIKLRYDDGQEISPNESHSKPNHLLWNFGTKVEKINVNSGYLLGSLLAPKAVVNANVNVDGNIVADTVNIVGGESHRWDLHGTKGSIVPENPLPNYNGGYFESEQPMTPTQSSQSTSATQPTNQLSQSTSATQPTSQPSQATNATQPTNQLSQSTSTTQPTSQLSQSTSATQPTSQPSQATNATQPTNQLSQSTSATQPTSQPSQSPSTTQPTSQPSQATNATQPTNQLSQSTSASQPTGQPSQSPSPTQPTNQLSQSTSASQPTGQPSQSPSTTQPTNQLSQSTGASQPTGQPSQSPSMTQPTSQPSQATNATQPTNQLSQSTSAIQSTSPSSSSNSTMPSQPSQVTKPSMQQSVTEFRDSAAILSSSTYLARQFVMLQPNTAMRNDAAKIASFSNFDYLNRQSQLDSLDRAMKQFGYTRKANYKGDSNSDKEAELPQTGNQNIEMLTTLGLLMNASLVLLSLRKRRR